ncbi:hypothetical protein BT67DRAFT_449034 [Trichocladium antarcticum]|uniref:Prolyl 4-hydroxylase alpha subunit domain-containing protein n=1 Tax=Trichocladium antarcticum TaxID=1450529 RepID=A0AAN6UMG2_9PEZI|nr:hypothetical protein BT67DRAFT_449034 [Trichocladium antarcticum]
MIGYFLAAIPVLLFFSDSITHLFPPSHPQIRRLPRPPLNPDLLALETNDASNYTCPPDASAVHIYSREPLVLYVENFLSPDERAHLLDISVPLYAPATITHDGASTAHDPLVRDSEVALIPRTPTVRCIEDRARALQGWRDDVWIERLRVQRYRAGGHYAHHFDWGSARGGWGRVSSLMVWVADREMGEGGDGDGGGGEVLEGGGTEFPLLGRKGDRRWCRFVECPGGEGQDGAPEGGEGKGVVFTPRPGNAVFWENFRADGTGRGYEETWHAGLPVRKGVKVGLNIWSSGRIE